jgi:hypothetical protein
MQSDFVQAQLKARASGTTVSGIKQSELRKVLLPVPEFVPVHVLDCRSAAQWLEKLHGKEEASFLCRVPAA